MFSIRVIIVFFLVFSITIAQEKTSNGGKFLDDLILKKTSKNRVFLVQKKFRYFDPKKTVWIVPVGTKVDGASIPKPLWSILGGPWSGKYDKASVIHDYFFEQKKYNSNSVHRVFYDAMITAGVEKKKAMLMYFAVLLFNDEWSQQEIYEPCHSSSIDKAHTVNCDEKAQGGGSEPYYARKKIIHTRTKKNIDMKVISEMKISIYSKKLTSSDVERIAKEKKSTNFKLDNSDKPHM